ncbi:MAG: ParA family protein [Lentisphaeria bacterium]
MEIVAFTMRKGGVGKTTAAVNIADGLAQRGKKVLMIDLDSQRSMTTAVRSYKSFEGPSIYGALTGQCSLKDCTYQLKENLYIAPSSPEMKYVDNALSNHIGAEFTLKNLLRKKDAEFVGLFDYIFIDCPPTAGIEMRNVLVAADSLILGCLPDAFSLSSLIDSVSMVNQLTEDFINENLKIRAIFINQFNQTNLCKNVTSVIEETYAGLLCKTMVRKNIAIAEAQGQGSTIFDYDKSSNGAKDFALLTEEIFG